jgi:hypothetical protein
VTSAGGRVGMLKAALLTLLDVYASAVIVRMRWPLIPPPLGVWTGAAFFCVVLAKLCVALRRMGPCCCRLVWLGRGTDFSV